jgi:hypothetical protein
MDENCKEVLVHLRYAMDYLKTAIATVFLENPVEDS